MISHRERASSEFTFGPGLNIILSPKNKTGKSCIVKSIFHTFGCSLVLEPSWKSLVDTYVVVWEFNAVRYTLMRVATGFYLYEGDPWLQETRLSFRGHFTKASSELAAAVVGQTMGIRFTWLTKKGQEVPPSLEHLLSFSYVDQDGGWGDIADSFESLNYITRWKQNLVKYVVGYQDDHYFDILKQLQKTQQEHAALALQMRHIDGFVDGLRAQIEQKHGTETDLGGVSGTGVAQVERDLSDMTHLQRRLIELNKELRSRRAVQYEHALTLKSAQALKAELTADHEFAMEADSELTCPFCGTVHTNDLAMRAGLIRDVDDAERLALEMRSKLREAEERVSEIERDISKTRMELLKVRRRLQHREGETNAITQFRAEGKFEVIRDSRELLRQLKAEVNQLEQRKTELDRDKRQLDSAKRKKKIAQEISRIYSALLQDIGVDIPVTLKEFLPKIESTGSEKPRLIYAYYVALFLYNARRTDFPLRWLVVDTLNQQGQDPKNLAAMYSLLDQLTTGGQVIIAGERETGREHLANVIRLETERRLLSTVKFGEHDAVYHRLIDLSK